MNSRDDLPAISLHERPTISQYALFAAVSKPSSSARAIGTVLAANMVRNHSSEMPSNTGGSSLTRSVSANRLGDLHWPGLVRGTCECRDNSRTNEQGSSEPHTCDSDAKRALAVERPTGEGWPSGVFARLSEAVVWVLFASW